MKDVRTEGFGALGAVWKGCAVKENDICWEPKALYSGCGVNRKGSERRGR